MQVVIVYGILDHYLGFIPFPNHLDLFVHEVRARGIHLGELRAVTRSLMQFSRVKRDAMWAFLKTIH